MLEMELSILNFIEDLISIVSLEREIATHEDIKQDAQRPNIALLIILPVQYFWTHIVRSACNSLKFFISMLSL